MTNTASEFLHRAATIMEERGKQYDKPGGERSMGGSIADKYPKYYRRVPHGVDALDTYAINQMFPVDDATGCILHARKKLLVPGTRTGGKSLRDDVREARDTLTRYLELTEEEIAYSVLLAESALKEVKP